MGRVNDLVSSDDDLPIDKKKGMKRKADGEGEGAAPRKHLFSYETLPPQLLNAYGRGRYSVMELEELWSHLQKPQRSGAAYMTELVDPGDERRGIGINRWLGALVEYCQYQRMEQTKKENEKVLKPELYTKVYEEIDKVLGSLEVVYAEKKKKR